MWVLLSPFKHLAGELEMISQMVDKKINLIGEIAIYIILYTQSPSLGFVSTCLES